MLTRITKWQWEKQLRKHALCKLKSMALSIRRKILVWISANWRMELHFPKFTNSRGAFLSIKLKFRCEFLEISMGEWYRLFQCEKRQAEQLCSLGIFQWFLGLNRKQNTAMSTQRNGKNIQKYHAYFVHLHGLFAHNEYSRSDFN